MIGIEIRVNRTNTFEIVIYVMALPRIGILFSGMAPPLKNIAIIVEIKEGAFDSIPLKSVVHLAIINASMNPNIDKSMMS